MRTYGRVTNPTTGVKTWVQVTTDANGNNDEVWIVTLIQCLKLNLSESPFYANYGIPAAPSVISQIFPDFYVAQTQSQFSQYFTSLVVAKVAGSSPVPAPVYNINVLTNSGAQLTRVIPV